jgi:hypothetical protein
MRMKGIRTGLAALLCFGAFWGAAHLGVPVGKDRSGASALRTKSVSTPRGLDLRRYLPVIR